LSDAGLNNFDEPEFLGDITREGHLVDVFEKLNNYLKDVNRAEIVFHHRSEFKRMPCILQPDMEMFYHRC
jgi:hypothetical protein